MKEYWLNAYHYGAMPDSKPFIGNIQFADRISAELYFPSWGLRVVYRIKVKLK